MEGVAREGLTGRSTVEPWHCSLLGGALGRYEVGAEERWNVESGRLS